MQRCSEKAYSICPGRKSCGPIEDAVFLEGSHCEIFNNAINGIVELSPIELSPIMSNMLRTGDPCPCCGQPIKTTDPVLLRLLTLMRDVMPQQCSAEKEDDYGAAVSGD